MIVDDAALAGGSVRKAKAPNCRAKSFCLKAFPVELFGDREGRSWVSLDDPLCVKPVRKGTGWSFRGLQRLVERDVRSYLYLRIVVVYILYACAVLDLADGVAVGYRALFDRMRLRGMLLATGWTDGRDDDTTTKQDRDRRESCQLKRLSTAS